ncbi:MAG: hypothetical protein ACJAVL_001385 [Bacteroidia bacterium]
MKRAIIGFFLAFVSIGTSAQSVRFVPGFGDDELKLDSNYVLPNGTEVSVETFRFYISNVEVHKNGTAVWTESASYHLLDAAKPESLQLSIPIKQGDTLVFLLGIDSLTNVSGAMGGDLDPSKGMYWAWNSGYINFKLEGTSPICNTRNNVFEFHLGGYAYPTPTVQRIELPVTGNLLQVDIEAFLNQINLEEENRVMSPSAEAAVLAKKAASIFHFQDEK